MMYCQNCNSDNIEGRRVESCSCHINPPCCACVDAPLFCVDCGHEQEIEDEPVVHVIQKIILSHYKSAEERFNELADGVFGYIRYPSKNGWGMTCKGKYPQGMTRSEILKLCNVCEHGCPFFKTITQGTFEFSYTYN